MIFFIYLKKNNKNNKNNENIINTHLQMWCSYCDEYEDDDTGMSKDRNICSRCHSYLDYCDKCDGRVMGDGEHCTCQDCVICTACKVCTRTGEKTTF